MSSNPISNSSAAPSLSPYPSSTNFTASPSQSPCIIDASRCNVYYPFLLGDGFCDEFTPYNTKDCCWDKGDCDIPTPTSSPSPTISMKPSSIPSIESPSFLPSSEPDKQNNQTFIYLPVTVALLVLLVICMVIVILKRKARDLIVNSQRESQSIQQTPLIGNESLDERDVRRQFILENIIHKKVVTKSRQSNDDKNDDSEESATTATSQDNIQGGDEGGIILPHEVIIRERSEHIASSNHDLGDEEQGGAINVKKDDICIETLRSIRSEMNLHLDLESFDESLYSPRSCPICCEDYAKGDDVAWSKNEDCCHAYHTDCIVPWLMDHDDCPMCRCVYVVKE